MLKHLPGFGAKFHIDGEESLGLVLECIKLCESTKEFWINTNTLSAEWSRRIVHTVRNSKMVETLISYNGEHAMNFSEDDSVIEFAKFIDQAPNLKEVYIHD